MDLTSIPDSAAYTAAVALHDNADTVNSFAGEVVTMKPDISRSTIAQFVAR